MSEWRRRGPVDAEGTAPPDRRAGCRPAVRRLAAFGVVGVALAILVAYGACRLIAAGWAACDDAEPPYLMALVFDLPILAAAGWAAWTLVALLTVRLRWWLALPIGLVVMLGVGYVGIDLNVPMNEAAYYEHGYDERGDDDSLPTCGPGGVPTWWPAWPPLSPG